MISGGKVPPGGVHAKPANVVYGIAHTRSVAAGNVQADTANRTEPIFSQITFGNLTNVANRLISSLWSERPQKQDASAPDQTTQKSENVGDKYTRCIGRGVELRASLLGTQRGWLGGELGSSPALFDNIKGNVKSIEAIPGSSKVKIVIDQVRVSSHPNETGDETFLRLNPNSHELYADGTNPNWNKIEGAEIDINSAGEITMVFDSEERLRSTVGIAGDYRWNMCD